MIDLEKKYRTEEGYEVKLIFIYDDEVYGHYKSKWGRKCRKFNQAQVLIKG